MNICMFTNTYLPHVGGVARSVHHFSQDLEKTGHRVLIVSPSFPETPTADPENDLILRVPAIQNFNGSDFSMRIPVPFYIDEKLDDFKADIIHTHHPYLLGDAAFRKTGQIPDNAFVIGHVGRLAPEKNLVFLAKSVAKSLKTRTDTWFCVAGQGPETKKFMRSSKRTN